MPASTDRDPTRLTLPAAETLLLRAAMASDGEVQPALTAWKAAGGYRRYDEIEFPATLLLPQIYRRLVETGLSDPWFPQLSRLTRYHMLRNLEMLRKLSPVLARIQQSGVRPLLTGGWALLAGGYLEDIQDRPLLVPQLLIQPADGLTTHATLKALNWSSVPLPPVVGWRNEHWNGNDRGRMEIGYQWLPRRFPFVGFADLARYGQAVELNGLAILVPSATDLVEQLCVQACQERPAIGYRIVLLFDVLQVLERAADRIDWERLLRQSQTRATLSLVRRSLAYLVEEFAAPVPTEWLERTWQIQSPANSWLVRHSPWQRYLRAEQAAGRSASGLGAVRYAWWQFASRIRLAKAS